MFPITCEEIVSNVERPRLFRSHSPSVVEKRIVSTDLTLSPFTKEAWSMHFSPRRFVCVCVCVSSIVLFVTYRFTYDRISCVGGRTSAYRVPRKSAPLSSMLFPFRPLSVEGTRKLAFVGAANSKGDVLTLFVEVHAVYDRFVALNYLWMKTPLLSSKLLLLYIIVVSLFGRGWFKKFGFLDFYCHIFFVIGVL